MSDIKKKKKAAKNARRSTDMELSVYAVILANPQNLFAISLEKNWL